MMKGPKLIGLIAIGVACSACTTVPAPRVPPSGPHPYQPPQPSPNTVPADFPNPRYERKVCKTVATDHGDKRVCMWQPRH